MTTDLPAGLAGDCSVISVPMSNSSPSATFLTILISAFHWTSYDAECGLLLLTDHKMKQCFFPQLHRFHFGTNGLIC
jgi:hypothetical protein